MNKKAFFLAAFTVLVWGSGFAAIRAGLLGGYTPGHLVLTRFLIASSVFVIYALWPGTKFRIPAKQDIVKILLLGWVGISVYHLGVTYGEETVSAGTAGMFIASAPIFTALIAVLVLKERLSAFGWIGMSVGFIGVVLITLGSEGTSFTVSKGGLLILLAAFATSVFFVFQKPLFAKYHPVELAAYFTWAGTIPFFIYFPGLREGIQGATLEANLSTIYMGLFPAALAYVTWAIALSVSEAGSVASMLYAEPVVAIIVAWLWLKEFPSLLSMIGGVVAISSVLIINWVGMKQSPRVVSEVE
ncbi:DMT family transport protein [Bacillus sp. OxB-1]|uniref:DMT family transporter n=1 Tax=Bacillus sp. (strain OxB-1) TaxID=98228 RepID=UPI00058212D6|nr:DMT family transporter [Bacillus sp. OxB-1]BAQ11047.1 DMT family transport protein [Bacillus sp. OxB-1]